MEKISWYSIIPKKGSEKIRVAIEIKNEKLSASKEKRAFFSDTAEAAENTAEMKASKNQFILLNSITDY